MPTNRLHPLFIQAIVVQIVAILLGIWVGMFVLSDIHAPRQIPKIECLAHQTVPAVHRYCKEPRTPAMRTGGKGVSRD